MFKKYWKKALSLFLVFTMLLQLYPLTVRAEHELPENLQCDPQTGMSMLYEYTPFEAGMAGTAYLNNYRGTLHLRRSDISLDGERLPVSIEFYHDAANDETNNPYGSGWSTSYNLLITYEPETAKYAYKNENGTWIYFTNSQTLDEEDNVIWLEDAPYGIGALGMELHIPINAANTDYAAVDLIYGDMHYAFDATGKVTSISDGINQITVTYVTGAGNSIDTITDPVGRKYCFGYSNGQLSSVVCYAADNTVIDNASVAYSVVNGQLVEVTYAASEKVTYEYDASGNFAKIINVDLCGYTIAYAGNGDLVSAITSKAAMGTEDEASGVVTDVAHPETNQTVITADGMQQKYTFDGCGRVTSCELLMATMQAAALDDAPAAQYQCVYGYRLTYGYLTNEAGATVNTVVDVESYDSDGVIEEPSEEETEPETTPEETEPTESETDGYECTEDAFGNILTESFIENGLRQTTTYTYSADGNYLVSKTDMNGNTVQYQYNLNTGVLESLIDANGNETSYTYNAMRELQNVHTDVSNLTNGTGMDVSYTYLHGRLMELTYGDYHYEFTYDIWGNVLTVTMNDATLVSYDYGTTAYKNEVNTLTYGNGQKVFYTYNALGQVSTIGYTDQPGRFQYAYSADGTLASIYDSVMQETTVYTENGYEIRSASNTVIYTYETDEDGDKTENINGLTFQTNYTETGVTIQDGEGNALLSTSKAYDAFSRIIKRIVSTGFIEVHRDYSYSNDNYMTGDLVNRYNTSYRKNGISTTLSFQYSYDGNGNIIGITKHEGIGPITDIMAIEDDAVVDVAADGINIPFYPLPGPSYPTNPTEPYTDYTSSYRYDEAGQLVEVIDGEVGKVYRYTYDASGNISTMFSAFLDEDGNEALGLTQRFIYVDGILTSVGSGALQTTYETDSMGNPVKIISRFARTEKTLTWGEGRMLLGISTGRSNNIAYTYNADGLRNQQVVTENGVTTTTKYIWGDNGLAAVIMDAQTIVLLYDDTGEAIGFSVHTEVTNPYVPGLTSVTQSTYTYVKNLQGDVIRILDSDGNAVVKYTYNPWGVPTVYGDAELAAINPCSYRGYYYDEETGYYYLQSRYYDPQIGRFINADEYEYLGTYDLQTAYNLFLYCCNAPISRADPTGHSFLVAIFGIKVTIESLALFAACATALLVLIVQIVIAIPRIARKLAELLDDLLESLQYVMEKALATYERYGYNNHHIIARTATAADRARRIWREICDMDINDSRNIARIKTTFHAFLHTSAYYAAVNNLVESAYSLGKKKGVLTVVDCIRTILLSISAYAF